MSASAGCCVCGTSLGLALLPAVDDEAQYILTCHDGRQLPASALASITGIVLHLQESKSAIPA